MDTTWHAFFLDSQLNIYSRYGGRDEDSAEGRQSIESLLQTMREVLTVHERRQRTTNPSDDDLHPGSTRSSKPDDIPLLKAGHQGCVHCHQVREYGLLQAFHDGRFQRDMLFPYPLPENIGIRIDRDHGHKLQEIRPDSAADRAGLRPADVLTRVNDVPVHSEQDVRWALHRATDGQPLVLSLDRPKTASKQGSELIRVHLTLQSGWRQTDLGWRKSLRSVPLRLGFLAYPLGKEERRTGNFPDDRLAIRVVSMRGEGLGMNLGLEKGDLIIAVGNRHAYRTFEQFKSDLLLDYSPGDVVKTTVLRNGQEKHLSGSFPEWHTTGTTVP